MLTLIATMFFALPVFTTAGQGDHQKDINDRQVILIRLNESGLTNRVGPTTDYETVTRNDNKFHLVSLD